MPRMENLLRKTPDSPTPEDALVTVYRVHVAPPPGTEDGKRTQRYEGYFFCLSSKPDPEVLLAGLSPGSEIILMEFDEIGEAERILGHASTRSQFDERGYVFKLGNIVRVV